MGRPPPSLPTPARILLRAVPAREREVAIGDLLEAHAERLGGRGRWAAAARTVFDALAVALVYVGMGLRARLSTSWLPLASGPSPKAFRSVLRRPGTSATVVLALTLGIGANTAIFSVLDAVVLSPLPYPEADRMVVVQSLLEGADLENLSGPEIESLRTLDGVFERVVEIKGYVNAEFNPTDGPPERFRRLSVSEDYFELYGVRAALGRTFRPEDVRYLTPEAISDPGTVWPVLKMVISHGLWVRLFGADPDVVGRVVRVHHRPVEVIGVMPEGFRALGPAWWGERGDYEAWYLSPYDDGLFPRDTRFIRGLATLRPGVGLREAQDAVSRLTDSERALHPVAARDGWDVRLSPLHDEIAEDARTPLLLMLGAVALVLLIACANVATILLARSASRLDALRVRRALGATRAHLIALALTEALVLAAIGTGLGLVLAHGGTASLLALQPSGLPRIEDVGLSPTVLGFTTAMGLASALLGGLLPAIWGASSTEDLGSGGGARTTASARFRRLASGLVALEIGAAVVLAIGTGLLVRSFVSLVSVDPGLTVAGVQTGRVQLRGADFPDEERRTAFFRRAIEALEADPTVERASVLGEVPFSQVVSETIEVHGGRAEPLRLDVDMMRVLPGALEALDIPVLEGRAIGWDDMDDPDHLVAVVDATLAARVWGDESPVGDRIEVSRRDYGAEEVVDVPITAEVVGVARPARTRSLRVDPGPTVWISYYKNVAGDWTFVARGRDGGTPPSSVIVDAVQAVAPQMLVFDRMPYARHLEGETAELSFTLALIGGFGGVGLLLALTGIYGLLSFTISQRRRELSIRAALGADESRLRREVLRHAAQVTGAGIGAGWLVASWASHLLTGLLFGVAPLDPWVFVAVGGAVASVGLAAGWIPGRRAGSVDPARVLTGE